MTSTQDTFDFVIIGAGSAGEAALELARERGASVAIIERDLCGGSCAFWACMPSKSLLHAAAVHHAGGDFGWQKASDFRDYMINREDIDYPSDAATSSAIGTSVRRPSVAKPGSMAPAASTSR